MASGLSQRIDQSLVTMIFKIAKSWSNIHLGDKFVTLQIQNLRREYFLKNIKLEVSWSFFLYLLLITN
jgi:hypothetical protein